MTRARVKMRSKVASLMPGVDSILCMLYHNFRDDGVGQAVCERVSADVLLVNVLATANKNDATRHMSGHRIDVGAATSEAARVHAR
eukprot:757812-Amphidinium_carterae.1